MRSDDAKNVLQELWSPAQIAGWLKKKQPHDERFQVSHETIYRSLYIQARGALKEELLQHLRRSRAMRRSRHHTQKTENHGRICDAVSISERPPGVADRAVPRRWEGDLILGSNNSQIATLVERNTRYVMLAKIGSKHTETVTRALRSPQSMAAWLEREHQWTTQAISSERNGSIGPLSSKAQRNSSTAEPTTQKDVRLRRTGAAL